MRVNNVEVYRFVSMFERIVFRGILRRALFLVFHFYLRRKLSKSNCIRISVSDLNNRLSEFCDKYGSDKGSTRATGHPYPWSPHPYTLFYESFFHLNRKNVTNLLECGVGTQNLEISANMGRSGIPGASLRVWRDFFPNATITGLDIDSNVIFKEDRIQTLVFDQTSESASIELARHFDGVKFDIIIDDGLHSQDGNLNFFRFSKKLLSSQGVWIVEDLSPTRLIKLLNSLNSSEEFSQFIFCPIIFQGERKDLVMNSLLLIRYS